MKKLNRLLKSWDFQKVIKNKRRAINKSFALYFYKRNDAKTKIGISVSKKLGNAVVRNKVKRQIRMMCLETFDLNAGEEWVIIAQPKYLEETYEKNLERLIKIKKKVEGE